MESTHDYVVSDLKAHINWLEKKLAELDDDPLAEAIKEYNSIEQNECASYTNRINELFDENQKLKEEIKKLKGGAKQKRPHRKQVLCTCIDCKTYFYAQRKDAKRCPECKRKHVNDVKREWLKKYRASK